jgi:hypothetical protein
MIDTEYVRALRSGLGGIFNQKNQEDAMEFFCTLASKCVTETKTASSGNSPSEYSEGE